MNKIKFIDLFSGIGGFRLGLESIGAKCVFSAEVDEHAVNMYKENFGDNAYCDITKVNPKDIPDFDILCAGFPCQSFSVCGKQKGFYDNIRGTLFFDIYRILKEKKPKAFILENVKNLKTHDKGNTLFVMLKSLNEIGYAVSYKVLNAKDFGVPQNRERIIIIGNIEGKLFDFNRLNEKKIFSMKPFLDVEGNFEYLKPEEYTILDKKYIKYQEKSGLVFCGYRNKKIRKKGVREGTQHLSRVHKQPNRIYSSEGVHPTLASQEQSGRYWIYNENKVRKLTIRECFRFMGFPDNFKLIGSNSNLYQRIGNSICVNMVEAIAKEILNQFWREISENMSVDEYIEKKYIEASKLKSIDDLKLSNIQKERIEIIVDKEEVLKGVYTVLVTSLIYKGLYPNQDVRKHQANLDGGYSGRSFDTKYVTPFLKRKQFLGAMKESGWLTRSLEQNLPYNMDFPGKINNKKVKKSFLEILNDIEENNVNPEKYLLGIFHLSIKMKEKKSIQLINPIESESKCNINDIINLLKEHFYYKYKSRGASILPVIAMYSIYECIMKEFSRFNGKKLSELASHNSSDKSSGNTGDIVIRNEDNSLYEVVEVKFDIAITSTMIDDAYKNFSMTPIQRYYILSTIAPDEEEYNKIEEKINKIRKDHGCQVIVNGLIPTLKYYLRLLKDTDIFLEKYIKNINNNKEVNYEHKLSWNLIGKEKA